MNDDFNTPTLIANLFDAIKVINSAVKGTGQLTEKDIINLESLLNLFINKILGFKNVNTNNPLEFTNEIMEIMLNLRKLAKKKQDYKTADYIREELNKLNIEIKDEREGTTWRVK